MCASRRSTVSGRRTYRQSIVPTTGDLLAYVRRTKNERFLVVLNLGGEACGLSWDALGLSGRLVLSTHLDRHGEEFTDHVALRPNEGVIAEL